MEEKEKRQEGHHQGFVKPLSWGGGVIKPLVEPALLAGCGAGGVRRHHPGGGG